ncbi:hypothetical protein DFH06DRAFT_1135528 [Mycena polygramma]|nr:hypothetical protein DFH06DRAFT_1135528 [Mycena polygramma]
MRCEAPTARRDHVHERCTIKLVFHVGPRERGELRAYTARESGDELGGRMAWLNRERGQVGRVLQDGHDFWCECIAPCERELGKAQRATGALQEGENIGDRARHEERLESWRGETGENSGVPDDEAAQVWQRHRGVAHGSVSGGAAERPWVDVALDERRGGGEVAEVLSDAAGCAVPRELSPLQGQVGNDLRVAHARDGEMAERETPQHGGGRGKVKVRERRGRVPAQRQCLEMGQCFWAEDRQRCFRGPDAVEVDVQRAPASTVLQERRQKVVECLRGRLGTADSMVSGIKDHSHVYGCGARARKLHPEKWELACREVSRYGNAGPQRGQGGRQCPPLRANVAKNAWNAERLGAGDA